MPARCYISDTNPNDAIGGGGCVCSEVHCEDCKGPFAIFPGTEMASNLSPHVVVSVQCARAILRKAKDKGQILSAGFKDQLPLELEPAL